jgi:hypothetical protein
MLTPTPYLSYTLYTKTVLLLLSLQITQQLIISHLLMMMIILIIIITMTMQWHYVGIFILYGEGGRRSSKRKSFGMYGIQRT